MQFTAQQIAEFVSGTIEGNPQTGIHTFAKIEEGVEGALSFYYDSKYEPYVYQTRSSIILVPDTFQPTQSVAATLIRVKDPREAIGRLLSMYESMKPKRTGIDPLAYVAPTAKIGKDVYLAPFAAVGDGADNDLLRCMLITFLFEDFEGVRDGIWNTLRVLQTPRLKQTFHLAGQRGHTRLETLLLLSFRTPLSGNSIVVLRLLLGELKRLIDLQLVQLTLVLKLAALDVLLCHHALRQLHGIRLNLRHPLFASVNQFRQ